MPRFRIGRPAAPLALLLLVAGVAAGSPAVLPADGPVRAGTALAVPTDREAARRRSELLRSPYTQVVDRWSLFGGEVAVGFEEAVPVEVREAAVRALETTVREVLDRDGWTRPFAPGSPLTLLVVHPRAEPPVLLGWDGREKGRLARPVVGIGTAGRGPEAVALDVARSVALLAVRQAGPDEAAWAVEGLAELLAREAVAPGLPAPSSPFLAAQGSLARPAAGALFLREAARLSPSGRAGLRAAWEEAGAVRGDDAESFYRAVAREAEDGAAGLLARLVAEAVTEAPSALREEPGGRLAAGDLALPAPVSLGWVRATVPSSDERGGLEVVLPDVRGARAARAALVYRPLAGEADTLPLVPGSARTFPLSGAEALSVVLVDGSDGGEVTLRLRRVPGYPALLASASAEWADGAVHLAWRTSAHLDLLAWVVSRLREEPDGSLAFDGREVVPTTDASDDGSGFLLVDREARPGERYRYRVWALTVDGLLAEAFEAAVETAR